MMEHVIARIFRVCESRSSEGFDLSCACCTTWPSGAHGVALGPLLPGRDPSKSLEFLNFFLSHLSSLTVLAC